MAGSGQVGGRYWATEEAVEMLAGQPKIRIVKHKVRSDLIGLQVSPEVFWLSRYDAESLGEDLILAATT